MTFSWKRTMAVFEKDLKDLSKNLFVLTTALMPLLAAALLARQAEQLSLAMHYMAIHLAMTGVATFVQSAIVAEEKEKNTLRGLMLSPAGPLEILGGKSLLSFLLTAITVALCAFMTGYEPADPLPVALALFVSILFYIALGTLLGLWTRSLIQASVVILPVIFLFGFGALLQGVIEQYPILFFLRSLPNFQLERLAGRVEEGAGLAEVWPQLGAIAGWVFAALALVVVFYRKRSSDD